VRVRVCTNVFISGELLPFFYIRNLCFYLWRIIAIFLHLEICVFLFLANYPHFSTFINPWLPIQKEMDFLIFFAAKWTWTDEDMPKGVEGRFGFAPKP
jgi:hypothetical protein